MPRARITILLSTGDRVTLLLDTADRDASAIRWPRLPSLTAVCLATGLPTRETVLLVDDTRPFRPDAPPSLALTATEIDVLDRLIKDKPKRCAIVNPRGSVITDETRLHHIVQLQSQSAMSSGGSRDCGRHAWLCREPYQHGQELRQVLHLAELASLRRTSLPAGHAR